MVKRRSVLLSVILVATILLSGLFLTSPVKAQTYRFTLPVYEVETYLQKDGSLTLTYIMTFQNDPSASPLDFVDVAMPQASYSLSNVTAAIDNAKINHVANSSYVTGIELGLGNMAIQPGKQGTVTVTITDIKPVLYPYDSGDKQNYANFQFTPNYFGSQFDRSNATKFRMTLVLPPGVAADQGVYFDPKNWPGDSTPQEASQTQDGRVYYSWYTENANVHSEYLFGTAFPAGVVPAEAISSKDVFNNTDYGPATTTKNGGGFWSVLPCCAGIVGILILFIYLGIKGAQQANKRKLAYLPPKISMAGQGIKRGLTAVEAAILLEEPMSKILTMILFGVIKKNAATVEQKDPLKIKAADPLPTTLYPYETGFIASASEDDAAKRKTLMQSTMIDLVKDVTDKMKGFSKKETVDYYRDIMNRAWASVQDSATPEVKSEQFEKVLEWTMLDGDFDQRTKRSFNDTVVFLPMWWGNFDPAYRNFSTGSRVGTGGLGTPSTAAPSMPGSSGSGAPTFNMPRLPGSDFAASLLGGMQATAAGIVGDITGFQGSITSKTNPVPVSRPVSGSSGWRGGGGGHTACACACACAGCACACAGGGR